jgi:hypothetical protein
MAYKKITENSEKDAAKPGGGTECGLPSKSNLLDTIAYSTARS